MKKFKKNVRTSRFDLSPPGSSSSTSTSSSSSSNDPPILNSKHRYVTISSKYTKNRSFLEWSVSGIDVDATAATKTDTKNIDVAASGDKTECSNEMKNNHINNKKNKQHNASEQCPATQLDKVTNGDPTTKENHQQTAKHTTNELNNIHENGKSNASEHKHQSDDQNEHQLNDTDVILRLIRIENTQKNRKKKVETRLSISADLFTQLVSLIEMRRCDCGRCTYSKIFDRDENLKDDQDVWVKMKPSDRPAAATATTTKSSVQTTKKRNVCAAYLRGAASTVEPKLDTYKRQAVLDWLISCENGPPMTDKNDIAVSQHIPINRHTYQRNKKISEKIASGFYLNDMDVKNDTNRPKKPSHRLNSFSKSVDGIPQLSDKIKPNIASARDASLNNNVHQSMANKSNHKSKLCAEMRLVDHKKNCRSSKNVSPHRSQNVSPRAAHKIAFSSVDFDHNNESINVAYSKPNQSVEHSTDSVGRQCNDASIPAMCVENNSEQDYNTSLSVDVTSSNKLTSHAFQTYDEVQENLEDKRIITKNLEESKNG